MGLLHDVLSAFGRSLANLVRPVVWWHLFWPGLAAGLIWLGLATAFWTEMASWLGHWLGGAYGGENLGGNWFFAFIWAVIGHMLLAAVLVPLVYVTAVFLFGVFAAPLMLERVAARDYAEIVQRGGGRQMASLINALLSFALFALAFVISLPFWFLPGVIFILPPLFCGWLNQRIYGFDALMAHADPAEFPQLRRQCRFGLFLIGVVTALLAWIPFVNLLAPAFAGLASLHYCLTALRHRRSGIANEYS